MSIELTESEQIAIACDCESATGSEDTCPIHSRNPGLWIDKPAIDLLEDVERIIAARVAEAKAEALSGKWEKEHAHKRKMGYWCFCSDASVGAGPGCQNPYLPDEVQS